MVKAGQMPAHDWATVNCEPLKGKQVDWIVDRVCAGGNVWILYQVGKGRKREMYLIQGEHVAKVAPRTTLANLRELSVCGRFPTATALLHIICTWGVKTT